MLFRHEPGSLPPLSPSGTVRVSGIIVDRPPPGLARGKYAASPWAIGALGGALVFGTLLYFARRSWRSRQ